MLKKLNEIAAYENLSININKKFIYQELTSI